MFKVFSWCPSTKCNFTLDSSEAVLLKMKLQQCNLKRSQISHHCHRMKWKKIQGKYKIKILTPPPPGSKVNPTSDVMQRRLKHLTNSRRGEKKTKVTLIINNSSGWKQNVKKTLAQWMIFSFFPMSRSFVIILFHFHHWAKEIEVGRVPGEMKWEENLFTGQLVETTKCRLELYRKCRYIWYLINDQQCENNNWMLGGTRKLT